MSALPFWPTESTTPSGCLDKSAVGRQGLLGSHTGLSHGAFPILSPLASASSRPGRWGSSPGGGAPPRHQVWPSSGSRGSLCTKKTWCVEEGEEEEEEGWIRITKLVGDGGIPRLTHGFDPTAPSSPRFANGALGLPPQNLGWDWDHRGAGDRDRLAEREDSSVDLKLSEEVQGGTEGNSRNSSEMASPELPCQSVTSSGFWPWAGDHHHGWGHGDGACAGPHGHKPPSSSSRRQRCNPGSVWPPPATPGAKSPFGVAGSPHGDLKAIRAGLGLHFGADG